MLDGLRLVEHYTSVQGEGPRTGILTQFVRLAGCNMRCPGWPCDTQHAINPDIYRKNSYVQTAEELFQACLGKAGRNICLTGGEPLLQDRNGHLQELIERLTASLDYSVEVFTNGSFDIPPWMLDRCTIMMDWKLTGSGEGETARDTRRVNAMKLRRSDGIKFVVADTMDLQEAVGVEDFLRGMLLVPPTFWVTPMWAGIHPSVVVDFMKKHRVTWRLSLQTHKYIWDADRQGV